MHPNREAASSFLLGKQMFICNCFPMGRIKEVSVRWRVFSREFSGLKCWHNVGDFHLLQFDIRILEERLGWFVFLKTALKILEITLLLQAIMYPFMSNVTPQLWQGPFSNWTMNIRSPSLLCSAAWTVTGNTSPDLVLKRNLSSAWVGWLIKILVKHFGAGKNVLQLGNMARQIRLEHCHKSCKKKKKTCWNDEINLLPYASLSGKGIIMSWMFRPITLLIL